MHDFGLAACVLLYCGFYYLIRVPLTLLHRVLLMIYNLICRARNGSDCKVAQSFWSRKMLLLCRVFAFFLIGCIHLSIDEIVCYVTVMPLARAVFLTFRAFE